MSYSTGMSEGYMSHPVNSERDIPHRMGGRVAGSGDVRRHTNYSTLAASQPSELHVLAEVR